MFKKFDSKENVIGTNQMKSSIQRAIKSKLVETYPNIEEHIELVSSEVEPLFFKKRDGPYYPTLRLLHMYPNIMSKVQVDKGAIKFVLSGAHIMCPGLTSPGARLPEDVIDSDTPVSIYAEGKEHALAIGQTKMSTDEIKTVNKGIGVDNVHYLNDGLWRINL